MMYRMFGRRSRREHPLAASAAPVMVLSDSRRVGFIRALLYTYRRQVQAFRARPQKPARMRACRQDCRRYIVTIKAYVARIVRPQDFVWLLLFSALAYVSADRQIGIPILLVLAALQVLEPKVEYFSTAQGNIVSILVKLAVSYALIGYTGGLTSSYYLILLLPLVSAATTLGQLGSALFTVVCCGAYVSFATPIYLDPARYQLDDEGRQELILR